MKFYTEVEIGTGEMLAQFIRFMEEKGIGFNIVDEDYFKSNALNVCKGRNKKSIDDVFCELGIRHNTTGWKVLKEIVPQYDKTKRLKLIYEHYGKKLGMTAKQVEKGIYNARNSVKRNNPNLYAQLFEKSNYLSHFLMVLKDMVEA